MTGAEQYCSHICVASFPQAVFSSDTSSAAIKDNSCFHRRRCSSLLPSPHIQHRPLRAARETAARRKGTIVFSASQLAAPHNQSLSAARTQR